MYSDTVMDHFHNPRNIGPPSSYNVKGVSGNPNAGPFMILYLNVQEGIVVDAGFETFGCGPAIAAASLLTVLIKGAAVTEVTQHTVQSLLAELGGLPLSKRHCADIGISALSNAIEGAMKLAGGPSTPGAGRTGL